MTMAGKMRHNIRDNFMTLPDDKYLEDEEDDSEDEILGEEGVAVKATRKGSFRKRRDAVMLSRTMRF